MQRVVLYIYLNVFWKDFHVSYIKNNKKFWAETNGINRKSIEKNQQNQKINKIDKPVSRLTEKKRAHTSY